MRLRDYREGQHLCFASK